jgi:hypothetical protein
MFQERATPLNSVFVAGGWCTKVLSRPRIPVMMERCPFYAAVNATRLARKQSMSNPTQLAQILSLT